MEARDFSLLFTVYPQDLGRTVSCNIVGAQAVFTEPMSPVLLAL